MQAAQYAKEQILKDTQGKPTASTTTTSNTNSNIPNPSQGASNLLANPVPVTSTFGAN